MKPTLFRSIILVLSVVLGVAVSVYLSNQHVSDQSIPPIDNALPNENVSYPPVKSLVISVPADGEFYIGKRRFDLTEISDVVVGSLATIPSNERVVYVKSATEVKFETLALVIKEVKRAGIERIEFVLDKKKIDPLNQTPVPPNTRLERTRRSVAFIRSCVGRAAHAQRSMALYEYARNEFGTVLSDCRRSPKCAEVCRLHS